jgi:4-hydroxy-tetrahydrodipicolinate synthase
LEPDLIAELAQHPNIVGVKEASGNIGQISRIIEDTQDEDFVVISGDDNITVPIMALGGAGVISVAANIDPKRMVAMCEAMKKGDYQKALVLHFALSPLFRSMFIDTNPIPVKKAVEMMGMAGGPVRLPLDELDTKKTEQLRQVLATIPAKSAVKRAVPKKAPQKAAARKPTIKKQRR